VDLLSREAGNAALYTVAPAAPSLRNMQKRSYRGYDQTWSDSPRRRGRQPRTTVLHRSLLLQIARATPSNVDAEKRRLMLTTTLALALWIMAPSLDRQRCLSS